jgi:23S rRNA pseudouridine1911/1915/1917 synthase
MRYDLEYTVKATDVGMTARGIARGRLGVSRRLMRKIASAGVNDGDAAFRGGVFINGRPARFVDKVSEGDVVGLLYPDESSGFVPQNIPIDVIYEDDDIIVVNKQPGVVVHPTKGHVDGTIANGLMRRMEERGERYKIRFVNRLDMNTSGALLVGKNSHAQSEFARQSGADGMRKLYIAVLDGAPARRCGNINLPIALEAEGLPRRVVRDDGAPSHTFYRVVENYSFGESDRAALALISITTGRTHQIRVHMAHQGCPVMGDTLYGRPAPALPCEPGGEPEPLIERQALHAAVLRFSHPRTRAEITVAAPPPPDIIACVRALHPSRR